MPPIKVYTNSPINAAKAEGITPKTAAPSNDEGDFGIAQAVGNASNTPVQNQIHAPLQPAPTRTTNSSEMGNNSPPPPQPGAVPYPRPTGTATQGHAPPAPAVTQAAQLPGGGGEARYSNNAPPPPPAQMGMSLMESTAPHTYRGTSSAPLSTGATNAAVPSTGSLGNRQVGHDSAGSYVGVGSNYGGGQVGYSPPAGGYQQRVNNDNDTYQDDADEEGVWNSAVKWAQAAGEKLSAAESEVWKRINKE